MPSFFFLMANNWSIGSWAEHPGTFFPRMRNIYEICTTLDFHKVSQPWNRRIMFFSRIFTTLETVGTCCTLTDQGWEDLSGSEPAKLGSAQVVWDTSQQAEVHWTQARPDLKKEEPLLPISGYRYWFPFPCLVYQLWLLMVSNGLLVLATNHTIINCCC